MLKAVRGSEQELAAVRLGCADVLDGQLYRHETVASRGCLEAIRGRGRVDDAVDEEFQRHVARRRDRGAAARREGCPRIRPVLVARPLRADTYLRAAYQERTDHEQDDGERQQSAAAKQQDAP